jgi:hypothetical protein
MEESDGNIVTNEEGRPRTLSSVKMKDRRTGSKGG